MPVGEVSFEQGSYTVAEGSTVTVKVTAQRRRPGADGDYTRSPRRARTGRASADYSGVPANVVFNASDTEKSFTFTATADDDNDDGESVKLGFGQPLCPPA